MMSRESNNRTLLTIGVFFLTIVVAVLLYVAAVITDWVLVVPVVFLLNGLLASCVGRSSDG
jgi:hypothetical protein